MSHAAFAALLKAAFHDEIALASDGRPALTEGLMRVLNAIWPSEPDHRTALQALADAGRDRIRFYEGGRRALLTIVPHQTFEGILTGEKVEIHYALATGEWTSTVAAPWAPGFLGLAAHVNRLRNPGDTRESAAYRLLGVFGAAAVRIFFLDDPEAADPSEAAHALDPSLAALASALVPSINREGRGA